MRRIVIATSLMLALSVTSTADPAPKSAAPVGDPQAAALLNRVGPSMLALRSYQAECDTVTTYPSKDGKPGPVRRQRSTLRAVKPNRMWYVQRTLQQDAKTGAWTPDPRDFGITFVCDGKTDWKQFGASYRTDRHTGPEYMSTVLEPWSGFYQGGDSPGAWVESERGQGGLLELRLAGHEVVGGMPCDKVFDHLRVKYGDQTQEYWETWFIGGDGLVRRRVQRLEFDGKPGFSTDAVIRRIVVNKPIPARTFAYAPPAGVKSEAARTAEQPKLLPNGTTAPDFTAIDKDGKPVKLTDYGGKVVVIDFWASWCPPCRESMPHNQEVAQKLQGEGLPFVLLAVDNSEERDAFSKWVAKNGPDLSALTFAYVPTATDVVGKTYHVTGIPTQYVIDPKGRITASFVGYGGPTGDLESAVRAALKQP